MLVLFHWFPFKFQIFYKLFKHSSILICFASHPVPSPPAPSFLQSCLLVWKYVLLHSSVKQPACIFPSDLALIAILNLKTDILLNFLFKLISLVFSLCIFAFCNAVTGLCYMANTPVCFAFVIHLFLMVKKIYVIHTGLPLFWLCLCILVRLELIECLVNTYNALWASILHGYGSLINRVYIIFWHECVHCGSSAMCVFYLCSTYVS